jgi:phosphatidylinositol-3-phosphatase
MVVVTENHSYAAITYPSEPNDLALFSGSTQEVTDDGCPNRFTAPNLAADLIPLPASPPLPSRGYPRCPS